ncbi:10085_t:CDS:1, partial [Funneliformis mosseae]
MLEFGIKEIRFGKHLFRKTELGKLAFGNLDFSVKCPVREFDVQTSGLREKVYSGNWHSGTCLTR